MAAAAGGVGRAAALHGASRRLRRTPRVCVRAALDKASDPAWDAERLQRIGLEPPTRRDAAKHHLAALLGAGEKVFDVLDELAAAGELDDGEVVRAAAARLEVALKGKERDLAECLTTLVPHIQAAMDERSRTLGERFADQLLQARKEGVPEDGLREAMRDAFQFAAARQDAYALELGFAPPGTGSGAARAVQDDGEELLTREEFVRDVRKLLRDARDNEADYIRYVKKAVDKPEERAEMLSGYVETVQGLEWLLQTAECFHDEELLPPLDLY